MLLLPAGLFIAGMVLLIKGADWLVDGASDIARTLGISDLVIGLTVVSFGTSTPELLVNIIASLQGNADIAIGNILGSNIANILLILGISATITPIAVQRSTIIKEIPFSLLAAFAMFVMANDTLIDGYTGSELGRGDGILFIGFFIIFLYYIFGMQKRADSYEEHSKTSMPVCKSLSFIAIGLAAIVTGGKLAVDGAIEIAITLGISQALIALTIVAVGTSLPELATSTVAAYKGKADIAVGNIVGSNIFNIFWILGISALIKPLPFTLANNPDIFMVVFSTILLFFIIHNGQFHRRLLLWWKQEKDYRINRWEGGILLATYFVYLVYIGWRV